MAQPMAPARRRRARGGEACDQRTASAPAASRLETWYSLSSDPGSTNKRWIVKSNGVAYHFKCPRRRKTLCYPNGNRPVAPATLLQQMIDGPSHETPCSPCLPTKSYGL